MVPWPAMMLESLEEDMNTAPEPNSVSTSLVAALLDCKFISSCYSLTQLSRKYTAIIKMKNQIGMLMHGVHMLE